MRCPQCKTPNPDTSPICSRCGRSLDVSQTNASAFAKPSLEKPADSPAKTASMTSVNAAPIDENAQYQPSGHWNLAGLIFLMFAGAIAAVLVGLLYFFIGQFINFIIIFPLIAGALVGAAMAVAVKGGSLRNPRLVGCVAALAGLLMMGTMHFARAYSLRQPMIDDYVASEMAALPTGKIAGQSAPAQTPAQTAQIEKGLRDEISAYLTPWKTLVTYETVAGEEGSSLGRGGSGIPIQGKVYWALRVTEVLLAVLACAAIASGAASDPFCEECDKWQEKEVLLRVHPRQNDAMWENIRARDWAALQATPPDTPDDKHATSVTLTSCPGCAKGTLGVTSIGGKVPAEFVRRNLNVDSVRALRAKSGAQV